VTVSVALRNAFVSLPFEQIRRMRETSGLKRTRLKTRRLALLARLEAASLGCNSLEPVPQIYGGRLGPYRPVPIYGFRFSARP
jgi:hypothetical protein